MPLIKGSDQELSQKLQGGPGLFTRNKGPRDDDRFIAQSGGGPLFELQSAEHRGIREGHPFALG